MSSKRSRRWRDFSTVQQRSIIAIGIAEVALLVAALADIWRRPAEQIKGSKRMWAAISFIQIVGPLAYFVFGRKRALFQ